MAAVLRRRKMREGFAPCLNSQEKAASYAGNQFPQHLTLSRHRQHPKLPMILHRTWWMHHLAIVATRRRDVGGR
jgi:hypothetical protein